MSAQASIQEVPTAHTAESLAAQMAGLPGLMLVRCAPEDAGSGRYTLVTARPFLVFRSYGSDCDVQADSPQKTMRLQGANPWDWLDCTLQRFESKDVESAYPLGGCFGYWGYGLRRFTEPKLQTRVRDDLPLPDCHLQFCGSLVVFDHQSGKTFVVSTGLAADGSRDRNRLEQERIFWTTRLATPPSARTSAHKRQSCRLQSSIGRAEFIRSVERAQAYIRSGDIYQVNLSQRLHMPCTRSGWEIYQELSEVSPAPYSAYLHGGDFELASSSPELFLRMDGQELRTKPIKGTRPRAPLSAEDARLSLELQTSAKERAELVMITDLLRNDLGKVCEFGSVAVPELARLERFAQVQHLVSTVTGRLRGGISHASALAACFPGGSITGAPKFRAMELIDELEPVGRGPYTGTLGYLGFNQQSLLSIIIRTALRVKDSLYFQVGAGIVADSVPADEYDETLAKANGFVAAVERSGFSLEGHDYPASSGSASDRSVAGALVRSSAYP